MYDKGLIRACENSGCGWKCCSFGSDGHIVILPHEFAGHEQEIFHLQIIDNDYFGGKKVKCIGDIVTFIPNYKSLVKLRYAEHEYR